MHATLTTASSTRLFVKYVFSKSWSLFPKTWVGLPPEISTISFLPLIITFLELCTDDTSGSSELKGHPEMCNCEHFSPLAFIQTIIFHRIMEWLGLDGTLKTIYFQLPCHGQGHHSLDQIALSPIQPWPFCHTKARTLISSWFNLFSFKNTKYL